MISVDNTVAQLDVLALAQCLNDKWPEILVVIHKWTCPAANFGDLFHQWSTAVSANSECENVAQPFVRWIPGQFYDFFGLVYFTVCEEEDFFMESFLTRCVYGIFEGLINFGAAHISLKRLYFHNSLVNILVCILLTYRWVLQIRAGCDGMGFYPRTRGRGGFRGGSEFSWWKNLENWPETDDIKVGIWWERFKE